VSGIERALHGVLAWVQPACAAIARFADNLWHRAVSLWSDLRGRHERLMDEDPRYPIALASGGAAVVKVVIANPSVVKAINALLADLVGGHDRQIPRPTYRPTSPWTSIQGSSLWEREEWDE
jgi:hypothetical protein